MPAAFPTVYGDDLIDTCALCRQAVRHRPYVPDRRVLICLLCFIVHAEPGSMCQFQDEAMDELRQLTLECLPTKGPTC